MLPLICYEAIFPGDIVSAGRAAGLDRQPDQ
jgi:apolipoprotein N-acyltransferase